MWYVYWAFVAVLAVLNLVGTIAISWWWIVGLVAVPLTVLIGIVVLVGWAHTR